MKMNAWEHERENFDKTARGFAKRFFLRDEHLPQYNMKSHSCSSVH